MTRNGPATIFGALMLAFGAAVLIAAGHIPQGFGYDAVGPALLPKLIGGGLVVSAIVILAEARLKRDQDAALPEFSPAPALLISAALLLEAALIRTAGWTPTVTALFAAGAFAFGDRRIALNLGIGFVLSLIVLVAFRFGLGIDLPLGPFETILER